MLNGISSGNNTPGKVTALFKKSFEFVMVQGKIFEIAIRIKAYDLRAALNGKCPVRIGTAMDPGNPPASLIVEVASARSRRLSSLLTPR